MKQKGLLFGLVFLVGVAGPALAAMDDIRLFLPSGEEARISVDRQGTWHFRQGGNSYALEKAQDGELVFKKESKPLATGRFKGEKLSMVTPSGEAYLLLKITSDKVKVAQSATDAPWAFKFKSEKVKVVHLGVAYGKVKYYSDSGKIKAKDRSGSAVAEIRGSSALTGAPGAFLVNGLSDDKRVCLALLLLSSGK
jgi:hypothetical protein